MFSFEVEFWDEDEGHVTKDSGLVGASSYGAAAERVANYYGSSNVIYVRVDELEDILVREDLEEFFKG